MKKLLIFPLLISYSSVQAITDCATQIDIPESECNTLLSLFSNTSGGIWHDVFINGWDVTQTPCTWTGITCEEGHVIEIDRADKGLDGTLPNLSGLTQLQVLDVSDNPLLTGTIDYQLLPASLEIFNFQGTELIEIEFIEDTATPSTANNSYVSATTSHSVSATQISETTDVDEDTPDSEPSQDGNNVTIPIVETTNDDGLPLLGQNGAGNEVNIITGKLFDSDSQFRGGISTDDQVTFFEQNNNLTNDQFVAIKGSIQIAEQHVGQKADLLVLGIYNVDNKMLYYTKTPQSVEIIEIGQFGIPIFDDDRLLEQNVILEESVERMLYEGVLPTGQLKIYFGYRLENQLDSIFYTPNPIRTMIE